MIQLRDKEITHFLQRETLFHWYFVLVEEENQALTLYTSYKIIWEGMRESVQNEVNECDVYNFRLKDARC